MKNIDVLVSALLLGGCLYVTAQADTSNTIEYSGTLIALPCTVDPVYQNMGVDFGGNINTKDLANGQRRYSKEDILFQLTDCNTALGNTISARFGGVSTTANGLLNVDAGSQASGVVIGLETPSGVALPINNQPVGSFVPITNADITIRLRSYLQAADGVPVESIVPGFFSATMTYTLMYQ